MKFSIKEKQDLAKAWFAISLAFAILLGKSQIFGSAFLIFFIISLVTVGFGFLLHELAHKYIAQKHGYWAEFRSDDRMLLLAIVMSFFGFIIAAPGGVLMPYVSKKHIHGIIALAGPMVNVGLAFGFKILQVLIPSWKPLLYYGAFINALLALFNMIPIWGFDGKYVFDWNKIVWGVGIVLAGFSMLLISY
ncbi:peptidase M50 [Candidatus Woesearchaeota archaeon]|nr:peptidase M50 [Candidatus Woesearchaeota archaeon]